MFKITKVKGWKKYKKTSRLNTIVQSNLKSNQVELIERNVESLTLKGQWTTNEYINKLW